MQRFISVLVLIGFLTPMSAKNAESHDALISKGDGFFHRRDYKEAARWFRRAVKKYPAKPIPRLALGHTLFALADFPAAEQSLREGLDRYKTWPRVRISLPGFFADKRDFHGSYKKLSQIVKGEKKHAFLLAYVHYFSGERGKALKTFAHLYEAGDRQAGYFVGAETKQP